jgi:hypothetical protein
MDFHETTQAPDYNNLPKPAKALFTTQYALFKERPQSGQQQYRFPNGNQ